MIDHLFFRHICILHLIISHVVVKCHTNDDFIISAISCSLQMFFKHTRFPVTVRHESSDGICSMLEELKRATNRRDDEVAIGVTFMGYDKIEEIYMKNERRGVKII